VQKEGAAHKGHTPRTCKKATPNSRYKSTHTHNSHCWQTYDATNRHHDRPATNSCDRESLPEESRGSTTKQRKHSKRLDHNPGQAKDDSYKTTTQCGSKTSAHTRPDKGAHGTPERPRETRVLQRNTNIPDLHKVGKEQLGVTPRDTKQPSENDVSPHARPPLTSTRSRAHKQNHPAPQTLHEVRELHTSVLPRVAPRNGLLKQ
ncbi:hypothetical protein Taro_054372, partial [Colocasia esculenta]|nr:hypothetical protein [Colocasia esculenta]